MSDTVTIYGQKHTVWTCPNCGVIATCPTRLYEHQRKVGGFHSCPNGHQWGWNKEDSEDEQIRRERDRLRQQQARYEDQLRQAHEEREATERRLSASKGQITKLRKRASAGVCPCCTRSFQNLRQHMENKHPKYVAEEVE